MTVRSSTSEDEGDRRISSTGVVVVAEAMEVAVTMVEVMVEVAVEVVVVGAAAAVEAHLVACHYFLPPTIY